MVIEGIQEPLQKIERVERLLRVTTDPPTLKILTARLEELRAKLKSTKKRNRRHADPYMGVTPTTTTARDPTKPFG